MSLQAEKREDNRMTAHRIIPATSEDTEAVLRLYREEKGRRFCFWNEDYPNRETIDYDLSREALFIMKDEKGEIMAAISVEKDEEVDRLSCWSLTLQPGGEFARLAVKPDVQKQGLARQMVSYILKVLKERGCKSVHILVNKDNVPAIRVYKHFAFRTAGECEMYDQHFLCYEKKLD